MRPIGIFGGTFDPIHYGHLRTAFEMLQALDLGEVRFMPSGDPPHRGQTYAIAARRLEMVRSLNKNKGPAVNAPAPVEIVLGGDATPAAKSDDGDTPEPIENQFGTSMTATLEALSTETIKAMQEQEEEEEEKKGGLLSRFRRT